MSGVDDDARERIKRLVLSEPDPRPGYRVINNSRSENPSIESVPCQVPGCAEVAFEVRDDDVLLCRKHSDEGWVR